MKARTRQVVLLVIAVLALAASVTLIATGISLTRHRRDLIFGLEELDILLEDRRYDEAASMLPWLAERATTAGEGLRVLKRAHALYESTGLATPLFLVSQTLLAEFPANTTIRTIAVFAAVRTDSGKQALELAQEDMGGGKPMLYAWALLSNVESGVATTRVPAEQSAEQSADGELLLARLDATSDPIDFERAWRLTGDERYALDAALLHLTEGSLGVALDLSRQAGLEQRWPLLHAGMLIDAALFDEAAALLEQAQDPTPDHRLYLADAYLYSGEPGPARLHYQRLVGRDRPPLEALLNLAYIEVAYNEAPDGAARADELLERARAIYPASFTAARAAALLGAATGAVASPRFDASAWTGTPQETSAKLLALQLSDTPERRGHAGELWQLVESADDESVLRYAAWYFAARDRYDDVSRLLGAHGRAWVDFYEGLIAARSGGWQEAADSFRESFIASPSWQAAHNAAIALYRLGDRAGGDARVQDALLLARHTTGDARIRAMLLGARASRDAGVRRRLVEEALTVDPDSSQALLLRTQLDNPSTR